MTPEQRIAALTKERDTWKAYAENAFLSIGEMAAIDVLSNNRKAAALRALAKKARRAAGLGRRRKAGGEREGD